MRDCRDCLHCKVKVKIYKDKGGNFFMGQPLWKKIQGVRCELNQWKPKETLFTALVRESYAFTATAEMCEFYEGMD